MATKYVSNAQQLATALAGATGGDTIVLRAGSYGALNLTKKYASDVTIKSEAALAAKFSSVTMKGASHVAFDGVSVAGEFRATDASSYIKLTRSDVDGGVYFKASSHITVTSNDIKGAMNAATFNDVAHASVTSNNIHNAQSDLFRITGDSYDFQILNNVLRDTAAVKGDHPDLLQVFGYNGQTPHHLTIKGNTLSDDPSTGATPAQGIFLSAPTAEGFRHILIEGNTITVGSPNSIFVNGGPENVVIRGNTLPVWPDGAGGSIRIVEMAGISNAGVTIDGNVARQILDETSSISSGMKILTNVLSAQPSWAPPLTSSPQPAPAPAAPAPESAKSGVYVSNKAELTTALAKAKAGDLIVLKSGSYGALDISSKFSTDVTIRSESEHGAKFSTITLKGASHVAFDGVYVYGEFRATDASKFVKLTNSDVNGGAYFNGASDIVVKGNEIKGAVNGLTLNSVAHGQITDNTIHDARSDLVRITGDSHHLKINNNKLLDVAAVKGDQPDMVQVMGYNGQTPHDIEIRGNVMYDQAGTGATPAQGVFLSAPTAEGFRNFLIEDNLINVGSPNSIYINGGVQNVMVRDNLLPIWSDGAGGGIRVVDKDGVSSKGTTVYHNVARQYLDETTSLSTGVKFVANTTQTMTLTKMLAAPTGALDSAFMELIHHYGDTDFFI